MIGVLIAEIPSENPANAIAFVGQTSKQIPQRTQSSGRCFSSTAPGGLTGVLFWEGRREINLNAVIIVKPSMNSVINRRLDSANADP